MINTLKTLKAGLSSIWAAWKEKGIEELSGVIVYTHETGPELYLDGERVERLRDISLTLTAYGPDAQISLRELSSTVGSIQAETLLRLGKFKSITIQFIAEDHELADF